MIQPMKNLIFPSRIHLTTQVTWLRKIYNHVTSKWRIAH